MKIPILYLALIYLAPQAFSEEDPCEILKGKIEILHSAGISGAELFPKEPRDKGGLSVMITSPEKYDKWNMFFVFGISVPDDIVSSFSEDQEVVIKLDYENCRLFDRQIFYLNDNNYKIIEIFKNVANKSAHTTPAIAPRPPLLYPLGVRKIEN